MKAFLLCNFLCGCLFFYASLVLAQEVKIPPANLPAELPSATHLAAPMLPPAAAPTAVPAIPVAKPSAPLPPAVQPSFMNTPITPRLQNAADNVMNLIENPGQIRSAIEQAPKTVPQQFQRAKEQVLNLNQDPSKFNGSNFEVLKWRNSLMFPPEQLNQLYNAARGLTDQSVGAVTLEVNVARVAPAFFLNSVLYNTPNNWTIWMNSRRIRAGAKFPELEISRVDRDAVEFIWQTEQLDFISPEWEKTVMPIALKPGEVVPRFVYQSKDGTIAVDRSRRYVRFVLGPHQTFVSRTMKITEGFVKSTTFDSVKQVATPTPGGGVTPIQIQPAPSSSPAVIPQLDVPAVPRLIGPAVK